VDGEVETSSREFVYRFAFPSGSSVEKAPRTEVEQHLTTFPPDSKGWVLDCPLCGSPIRLDVPLSPGA